jgi:hypothetical protein
VIVFFGITIEIEPAARTLVVNPEAQHNDFCSRTGASLAGLVSYTLPTLFRTVSSEQNTIKCVFLSAFVHYARSQRDRRYDEGQDPQAPSCEPVPGGGRFELGWGTIGWRSEKGQEKVTKEC